ncbi:MAG: 23S rRNA (adenine(2503)-C(2))-methyltransferase RlmN [bacterium]|nr:23S rRNA (adenine(2503)-C(2))-methyltransferase RlmN [bacterium]
MNILSLSLPELSNSLSRHGLRTYVAEQIYDWIYKKYCLDFNLMTNLSKNSRTLLGKLFDLNCFIDTKKLSSSDDLAIKYGFTLADGHKIETVVLKEREYYTLCVSSQVGCALNCGICLTGKSGFVRDLTVQEIIAQVLYAYRDGYPVSHLVFMGMGEPLMNTESLFKAIEIINDPLSFNIGKRKITISTSGVLLGLKKFFEAEWQVNLALSVGHADPLKRAILMPVEKNNPILEVIHLINQQKKERLYNRKISLEYTLLEGFNDDNQAISDLVNMARYLKAKINLINLNAHKAVRFKPVSEKRIKEVKSSIQQQGVPVTIRMRKGQDIQAACGQLNYIE